MLLPRLDRLPCSVLPRFQPRVRFVWAAIEVNEKRPNALLLTVLFEDRWRVAPARLHIAPGYAEAEADDRFRDLQTMELAVRRSLLYSSMCVVGVSL